MQIPSAGMIEEALKELALDGDVVNSQLKELRAVDRIFLQQAYYFLAVQCSHLELGYLIGLETCNRLKEPKKKAAKR